MIKISPFRAFYPQLEYAQNVVSPAYDVVSRQEAREIAKDNPYSFLRVTRSDLEFDDATNPYSDKIYEKARKNLEQLIEKKILVQSDKSSFYIYQIKYREACQTGLVALFSSKDYRENRIKKHELTREEKEKDRTKHIQRVKAHTGPVFLLHREEKALGLTQIMEDTCAKKKATCEVYYEDVEETHSLYSVQEESLLKLIQDQVQNIDSVYIADGHHRAASAAKATLENTKAQYFLGVSFPDTQLNILPYYRVIIDLNHLEKKEFLQKIQNQGIVLNEGKKDILSKKQANLFLGNKHYHLDWSKLPSGDSLVENLNVSILQNQILAPILGIENPRKSERLYFIGGVHGEKFLEDKVKQGHYALAFSTAPIEVKELLEIADDQKIMPPKSTWFEPKLRSGLVCNYFNS